MPGMATNLFLATICYVLILYLTPASELNAGTDRSQDSGNIP
jgi:hypothetical protein